MNRLGTLHLIPVSLGEAPLERWLPAETQAIAQNLEIYIAENAKTARAFLKQARHTDRNLGDVAATAHSRPGHWFGL